MLAFMETVHSWFITLGRGILFSHEKPPAASVFCSLDPYLSKNEKCVLPELPFQHIFKVHKLLLFAPSALLFLWLTEPIESGFGST